jgi:hypothetical protein
MKFLASILILLAVTAKQCASFESQVLDDSSQIAVVEDPEIGTPACQYQKGTLDDFGGEIYSWWVSNDQTKLSRVGDTLKVVGRAIGSKWDCFGTETALLDFTACSVIKIRCRAEGEKPPTVIIHMKDVNQMDANADSPKQRIHLGKDYRDYYFDFNNKWKQSWPDNQKVDEKMIHDFLIFINGGMADWTGTLYIDYIKVVSADEMPKVVATAGGMVDDFQDELYSWWAANEKLNLEKKGDVMSIECTGVGPAYETFGRAINQMDFTKAQIVRVKARAEGGTPNLRMDYKDKNGHTTNEFPLIMKIDESSEFKNYYYNYAGKYSQTYPDVQTVDPTGMKDVIFFVNPGGEPFTGKIFIDEIEVITDKQYQELTGKK